MHVIDHERMRTSASINCFTIGHDGRYLQIEKADFIQDWCMQHEFGSDNHKVDGNE